MMTDIKKQSVHNIAIYLRLSKDDGDIEESESISNQRKIILDYINENFNYENYYEYVDDGISGATFNRPAFKKMICELETNKIDLIITKNLARFARNYIDAGDYIEKIFPDNNIRYIAILDRIDNFEDRVENEFAPIKGVFNELFCKETSKNVKRSKRKKMADGFYSCNVAPYGYKKDPENPGKLIIDEYASKVVKRIFRLTLDGKTAKQIADLFNKEGILTPAQYLKVKGLENRTKKVWTRIIITRILSNEVYTGKCLRGKSQNISYKSKQRIYVRRNEQIVTENTHEPIISQEIFDKIHNNNKFGKLASESKNIEAKFAKYMYCSKCKAKMAKKRSRNNINIQCSNRDESDFICSNNDLYKYESLEDLIIDNIKEEFDIFFKKNRLNPNVINNFNTQKKARVDYKMENTNKELRLLRFKITKLYNDRLQDNVTEEDYKISYTKLTKMRKELEETIRNLENERNEIENNTENISKIKKAKKGLKNLSKETLREEDIDKLIEKIEVNEECIHIFYKFKKMPSRIAHF